MTSSVRHPADWPDRRLASQRKLFQREQQMEKPLGPVTRNVVDILCVMAIVAGVTCSLGTGTMQISSGLNQLFGVSINKLT
jgi:choline-glycine betaine transporter